jgi:hypothetical protein
MGGGQDEDTAHEFGWEDAEEGGNHGYCTDNEDTFSDSNWEFTIRLFHNFVENGA